MSRTVAFLSAVVFAGGLWAGPVVARVEATSDHADCRYAVGERSEVRFAVTDTNGVPLKAGRVTVKVDNFGTREMVPERTVDLANENPVKVVAGRETPGFLRITLTSADTNEIVIAGNGLWGRHLREFIWGQGFDVEKIVSGTPDVADFDAFWSNAVARLDATVPVDARLEPLPSPDPAFRVYRISVATAQDRRVWGWITEPCNLSKGPYPVHLEASGAGEGWTSAHPGIKGAIVCRMTVHTFEPPEGGGPEVSAERRRRYLAQVAKYATPNGVDDYYCAGIHRGREGYFYYAVILGLNRMVDWLAARPECDASRMSYGSASQGGGLGLALTYLNRHISRTIVYVPAITDLLGFRAEAGRQSGWPELVERQRPENRATAEANAPYFCGVNFARRITKPIRFVVGYIDLTCPPNAGYAACNACPSKDKSIAGGVAMGHRVSEPFSARGLAWELWRRGDIRGGNDAK